MSLLHIAGNGTGSETLYPEDVFVSYLRTGTGADVTVTTGIDYTKGFMTWTKGRSGATDHAIYDSARGVTKDLVSNSTAAETAQATGLKSVSTTGHTIGSLAKMNTSGATYVDWVFRKAPKFFDIVTYTGNGVAGRQIPHSLGCEVGMIIVKDTANAGTNWWVWHRNVSGTLNLNTTTAAGADATFFGTVNSTVFGCGASPNAINLNTTTYVAYLFAHDPSADGIIQCGSFTTDASGNATVNLGWEPQYIISRAASTTGYWAINDCMRGSPVGSSAASLFANVSDAESAGYQVNPTATGFNPTGAVSQTFIYLAIRRPMKVPTSGTEVYNAIARTGTGAAATVTGVGFAPDALLTLLRTGNGGSHENVLVDKLRGKYSQLYTNQTQGELTSDPSAVYGFLNDGVALGPANSGYGVINVSGRSYINHFFRRAKGFFDVVQVNTGESGGIPHNLGVEPELVIQKSRNTVRNWFVTYKGASWADSSYMYLNLPNAGTPFGNLSSSMTQTTFYSTENSAYIPISYLFATLAGVSKVGSYTGNGSSQTINCGFSTGARFILVKRTDSTGDWFIWDTARGVVANNDPHLSLNTTAANVATDDSIDPASSGFIVNQNTATNINVSSASYIFLAIS